MKVKIFLNKREAIGKISCITGGWTAVRLQGDPNFKNKKNEWVLIRVSTWCDNPDGSINKCSPIPQFLMEDGSYGFPLDED